MLDLLVGQHIAGGFVKLATEVAGSPSEICSLIKCIAVGQAAGCLSQSCGRLICDRPDFVSCRVFVNSNNRVH